MINSTQSPRIHHMLSACTTGLFCLLTSFLFCISASHAGPTEAYRMAINLAAQGDEQDAITSLSALIEVMPQSSNWHERMFAAQQLIRMKTLQQTDFPAQRSPNPYISLAAAYASSHPLFREINTWPAAILATLLPGAGHAWLGRWYDARTAALMVWPLLLLTLWAFKRGMGPVTLFFALVTLWLWSGTVFSAISLAERGNLETYLIWWQHVWQSSGLPGRPW